MRMVYGIYLSERFSNLLLHSFQQNLSDLIVAIFISTELFKTLLIWVNLRLLSISKQVSLCKIAIA